MFAIKDTPQNLGLGREGGPLMRASHAQKVVSYKTKQPNLTGRGHILGKKFVKLLIYLVSIIKETTIFPASKQLLFFFLTPPVTGEWSMRGKSLK